MALCDKGGGGPTFCDITFHKAIYLSLIQYNFFYFVNVMFTFIPMFDLMLILLKK